jgi:hypothetical protein
LWVEPYLAAGHCIYIHPDDIKYKEAFDIIEGWELCRYNVIDRKEYLNGNEILKMREASCQSSYIPYSGGKVVHFLSQLFPKLVDIVNNGLQNSTAYTWTGDFNQLKSLGLERSDFAKGYSSYEMIEHKL